MNPLFTAILTFVCLFSACTLVSGMEQQAIYGSPVSDSPWWAVLGIICIPGITAVTMTMLLIRYLRVFAIDERKPLSKREVFRATLAWGALFGVFSQVGLQGLVNYLTGLPIMWELMIVAVMCTGLASMLAYEAVRVFCAWRFQKGEKIWRSVYNWISVKQPEVINGNGGDDITDLMKTRIMTDAERHEITGPKP